MAPSEPLDKEMLPKHHSDGPLLSHRDRTDYPRPVKILANLLVGFGSGSTTSLADSTRECKQLLFISTTGRYRGSQWFSTSSPSDFLQCVIDKVSASCLGTQKLGSQDRQDLPG